MSTQKISLENFEEIYEASYNKTLTYIICKCANIDDVNDILQDTYVELYKILNKKQSIVVENAQSYIIGIAKKRIKRYYGLWYKTKEHINQEEKLDIPDNIDIEASMINKLNAQQVWNYIRKKNGNIVKIFYLYYYEEFKIAQIAKELNLTESNVKNLLYRTVKDIKENIKISR